MPLGHVRTPVDPTPLGAPRPGLVEIGGCNWIEPPEVVLPAPGVVLPKLGVVVPKLGDEMLGVVPTIGDGALKPDDGVLKVDDGDGLLKLGDGVLNPGAIEEPGSGGRLLFGTGLVVAVPGLVLPIAPFVACPSAAVGRSAASVQTKIFGTGMMDSSWMSGWRGQRRKSCTATRGKWPFSCWTS